MASRHYGATAYVLHVWHNVEHDYGRPCGPERFILHDWKIYGTEAVARSQGVRIVEEWKKHGRSYEYEVFPMEGAERPTD